MNIKLLTGSGLVVAVALFLGINIIANQTLTNLRLDVTDAAGWEEVVGQIMSRHGGIDLAYLNAGITTYPAAAEGLAVYTIDGLDLERYRRIMGVNIDGVVLGTRRVICSTF